MKFRPQKEVLVVSKSVAPLPQRLKHVWLRLVFGWKIDPSARIGFCLLTAESVQMGAGSRIGHFTAIRNIWHLALADHATIGPFNWIFGVPRVSSHFKGVERDSSLQLGEHSAITARHMIDVTDSISIGSFSTVAGFRSQLLTHSIRIADSRQGCKPISIGRYCFIGTEATVLGGVDIPDFVIVGAKALVSSTLTDSYYLYGGVPAAKIKPVGKDSAYFHRTIGRVS